MTQFLWDASHYDDVPRARDGISAYVHKAAEGHWFYRDSEYGAAMNAARSLGYPVLGAYFVLHPGAASDQVDFLLDTLKTATPWWPDVPWIFQIDCEKFDYMSRAPTITEINAFADELIRRTGVPSSSVLAYAPKWLYGAQVSGLRYAVWASEYGSNPPGHYPDVYPGDGSSRWAPYGGKTPLILQYGSNTTIAGQTTSDANGFRGTLEQLLALTAKGDGMSDFTTDDRNKLTNLYNGMFYGGPSCGQSVTVTYPDGTTKTGNSLFLKLDAILASNARIEAALAAAGGSVPGGGATPAEVTAIVNQAIQTHEDTEAGALRAAADKLDPPA